MTLSLQQQRGPLRSMAKIVDEGEARRWIEEGRTYKWMAEETLRKYNVEITPVSFSHLRCRLGIERRITRDDTLIPWDVKVEHRWDFILAMLRAEGRIRAGQPLTGRLIQKHASFMEDLKERNLVVYYDPDTPEGFFLVPREEGDKDIIRQPPPGRRTQRRRRD